MSRLINIGKHKTKTPESGMNKNDIRQEDTTNLNVGLLKKKHYRYFLEHVDFGYIYCKLIYQNGLPTDLLCLDVNRSFVNLSGFSDPVGQCLSRLLPSTQEYRNDVLALFNQVVKTRERYQQEYFSSSFNKWIVITAYCPRKPFLIITMEDISERKRIQNELFERESHFKLITDNTQDIITQYTLEGIINWVSPSVKNILGYDPQDLIGNLTPMIIHPEDQEKIFKPVQKSIIEQSQPVTFTCRMARKDGSYRWMETIFSRLVDEAGAVYGHQSTARDVTQRVQALQMLQIERDLGLELSKAENLEDACTRIMDAMVKIEGVDCGGVYILDQKKESLDLLSSWGLSPEFLQLVSHYEKETFNYQLVQAGKSIYTQFPINGLVKNEVFTREGILGFAMIPVLYEGNTIASINLASHHLLEFPDHSKTALESMASHLGSVLARVMAKKALFDSQRNLSALFDSINEYIIITDLTGKILLVNPLVNMDLGYMTGELIGQDSTVLLPPDLRINVDEIYKSIIQTSHQISRLSLIAIDGRVIPVETKIHKGIWDGKEVFIGVSRDITERIKAEEDVRTSETHYRQIVETANEGICSLDKDFIVRFVNQAMLDMLGYSPDEIIGKEVSTLLYAEDLSDHARKIENRKRGNSDKYERRFRKKDGSECWTILSANPIMGENGTFLGSFIMLTDITLRKKLELELANSEKKYRELVEWQGEGLYITDDNAAFTYANSIAEHLFGVGPGELIGRNMRELLTPDQIEIVDEQISLRTRKIRSTYELTVIHQNGHPHHLLITATPRLDDQQKYIGTIGICRDITQRKEKEERLQYISFHDSLTGLFNRSYYEDILKTLETGNDLPVSVIMIDVDGLKKVNDQFGHSEGDRLLQSVADILRRCTRDTDITARIGGDEFVVLLPFTSNAALKQINKRILIALKEENNRKGKLYETSISFGSYTAVDGAALHDAPAMADSFMYEQKREKKGQDKLSEDVLIKFD
jgi:diguanylate cyclase (GGDEF)-like protein/PAS domain S-box-containing protein